MKKILKKYPKTPKERRCRRVRSALRQNKSICRLSVFRSGRYVYAQVIDDNAQRTLAAASSLEKAAEVLGEKRSNCEAASWVGALVAKRALEKGIERVVFDRGSYRFHGRVKALAEGARAGGMSF